MADVVVATAFDQKEVGTHRMVTISATRAIFIYKSGGGAGDIVKSETLNGGASWAAGSVIDGTGDFHENIAVWYSRWTRLNTDEKIHIVTTNQGSGDGMWYHRLDVSGATSVDVSHVEVEFPPVQTHNAMVDNLHICQLPSGQLWIMHFARGGAGKFFRLWSSDDDGVTWDLIVNESGTSWTIGSHDPDAILQIRMVAGPGAFEDLVPWFIFYTPGTENAVWAAIYFNNQWFAWTIASAAAGDGDIDSTSNRPIISAVHRHTDGLLYITFFQDNTPAQNALQCWTVNEILQAGIRKTDVLANPITDTALGCVMCIDQSLGSILVAYLRGPSVDSMKAYYKISRNGGQTWSAETAMTEGGNLDVDIVDGPPSTPGIDKGRFQVVTWNDDNQEYLSSNLNNLPIGGYTVHQDGPGGEVVDCQTGVQESAGGAADPLAPLRRGYGDYQGTKKSIWLDLGSSKRGSFVAGELLIGVKSGATATFISWNEDLNRILLGNIKRGHKIHSNTPFLPGETIQSLDGSKDVTMATRPAAGGETSTDFQDTT